MIEGQFGSKVELIFEIYLIADDGLIITVDALLDTGVTDWLAIHNQDAESLGLDLGDKALDNQLNLFCLSIPTNRRNSWVH